MKSLLLSSLICLISFNGLAKGLDQAPENFLYKSTQAVFVDIQSVDIHYVFDVESKEIKAESEIIFDMPERGYPIFDLIPDVKKVLLAGKELDVDLISEISDPDKMSKFRILEQEVLPSTGNKLLLSFEITDSSLFDFSSDEVKIGFFMSDLALNGREYLEQYGPTNFEFDQIRYTFDVDVVGTEKEHEIFANGVISKIGFNKWQLKFPEYYTASSLYFHLAEKGRFIVKREDFQGKEKIIPLVVYAASQSRVRKGLIAAKKVLAELEEDYGPYSHDHFIAYMTGYGGGMEYCGATMTSLRALSHEITHFWFARSVMPSKGNSGWVDEAIASWRDNDYPRSRRVPDRSAINLGGFSQYRRSTTRAAYNQGADFMSELDYIFSQESGPGLKPVLRQLFSEKANSVFTMDFFEDFIISSAINSDFSTGFSEDLDYESMFSRYVYGDDSVEFSVNAEQEKMADEPRTKVISNHPRPFTQEEIKKLR